MSLRGDARGEVERFDEAIGFGDVAADDIEGAAARARGHGHRQAAVQRDAAVEAHELHRDLALVVVHRHHRIEIAAARGEEHRVGRQRPRASMPSRRERSTAGAMMSISSRPIEPPSPACGLSPATAMRGAAMPAALEIAIGDDARRRTRPRR